MSGGDEYCIDSFYEEQKKIHKQPENEYAPLSPQDWNLKVGKDVNPEDSVEARMRHLYNEFSRLLEESSEGVEGAENIIPVNILDAYCDIKFVFKNLENRLRKYGYDVDGAFEEVCINNSLKYTTNFKLASEWKREWYDKEPNLATMINVTTVEGIRYYCIKRISDDKVLKPLDHVGPELTKYLPEEM